MLPQKWKICSWFILNNLNGFAWLRTISCNGRFEIIYSGLSTNNDMKSLNRNDPIHVQVTQIHKFSMDVGRRGQGAGSVNFEIWYFPTKFFVKRVVFLVSDGQKWNFITFHHWITLFGYPWNKSFRRPWDAGKHDKALSSMAVSLYFLKIQNQIRWKGIICPFPFLFFKSEPTWKSSN